VDVWLRECLEKEECAKHGLVVDQQARGKYSAVRVTDGHEAGSPSDGICCDFDLVHFQAGVDPLANDRLGRLNMTRSGLHRRNAAVLRKVQDWNAPLVVTMGGGYSRPIQPSIRAHADVFVQSAAMNRARHHRFAKAIANARFGSN